MEYYSTIKSNEIMSFAAIWMDLEIIILNGVCQKDISYAITYLWNLKKKWYQWAYLQNRNRHTDIEVLVIYGYQRGREGKG